jgi:predicted MFS family arabinose efflux permease
MGIPLNGLDNVQYLLDKEQRRDSSILSIDVVDPRGRILFSSHPGRSGQTLHVSWNLRKADAGLLRDLRSGVVTLGQPLMNAFNETLGAVLLQYATDRYEVTEATIQHYLTKYVEILAVAFGVSAWLGFSLLLRGFRGSVRHMSTALESVLRGGAPDEWRPCNGTEQQFSTLLLVLRGSKTDSPTVTPGAMAPSLQQDHARVIVRRMFGLATLLLVLPLTVLGLSATVAFETALVPEMHQKAAALARAVAADVDHAVQVGIPLEQLVEPGPYLAEQLGLVPEARYLAIARGENDVLHAVGRTASDIASGLAQGTLMPSPTGAEWQLRDTAEFSDLSLPVINGAASVHVGISRAVLAQQKKDIAANVVVLSSAGLLVTFEILLLVAASGITHPLTVLARLVGAVEGGDVAVRVAAAGGSDVARLLAMVNVALERLRTQRAMLPAKLRKVTAPNLVFIRTPMFFFCFAEEMVRSFMPLYAANLAQTARGGLASATSGGPNELLVGLPITVFMAVVAVSTPLMATYSDRLGRRPIFLAGAFISSLGLLLSAVSMGYWWLLASRGVCGIGYAAVFMAGQGYVLDNTSAQDRSQGLSLYVGAIAAADLCGPPIGGIVADQIGFQLCFVFAAVLVGGALLLAWCLLQDSEQRLARPKLRWRDVVSLVHNGRLMAMVVGASIPAKLLLTGFLFYLVPLHLSALGQVPSMVGRVIMVYALGSLLIAPLVARLVDRWHLDQAAVFGGNALAGFSLLLLWEQNGVWPMVIAVGGFGIGQAISISSQITLATRYAAVDVERMGAATVISVLRLFERVGATAGPLVAGALLSAFGNAAAIPLLGAGALLLLLMFAVFLLAVPSRKRT